MEKNKTKTETTSKGIWSKINFKDTNDKSAYDYLKEQSGSLIEATGGILKMEIEAVDSYIDGDPPILAAIYTLYVVAPKLGNFRRKILSVAEYSEKGRFPVDIFYYYNDGSDKIENVEEINFIDRIEIILTKPFVQDAIKNLYKQSKENSKSVRTKKS